MPPRVPTAAALLVLLVLALSAGCSESRSVPARRLLTSITTSTKRLESAAENFGKVVARRLDDKATDADLRGAIKSFRSATKRIREDTDKWPIPKTPEAAAMVDAFRQNLDRRVEVIDELEPRIVETMASAATPLRQKAAKAREMFEEASKRLEAENTALRRAQREYAATAGVFAYD